MASGVGWPTSLAPVVDMTEHTDSTRSGWAMAIDWTIIPPMEAPTMWARAMPRASSRPTASSAMSASR